MTAPLDLPAIRARASSIMLHLSGDGADRDEPECSACHCIFEIPDEHEAPGHGLCSTCASGVLDEMQPDVIALCDRVEALEAALRRYGAHRRDCQVDSQLERDEAPCTCGLDAAITESGR